MEKGKRKRKLGDIFGKKNDSIQTPPEIYGELDSEHHFDFDPCPLKRPKWDGLKVPWGKSNFINPPFSEIKKWLQKGIEEKKNGNKSVFLLTARVSSKYWFDLVFPEASQISFLEGAFQFPGFERKFPIPLALVVFHPEGKEGFKPQKFLKKRILNLEP